MLDHLVRQRLGQQLSIREALLWTAGCSFLLALPHWVGLSALPIVFDGTLAALTWRLAKALPFGWALTTACFVATTMAISACVIATR